MRRPQLIIIALSVFIATFSLEAGQLKINLKAADYDIMDGENGLHKIMMADFSNLLVPGKPMLPARVFTIALPPRADVISVDISGNNGIELPGTYKIEPAPSVAPCHKNNPVPMGSHSDWQKNYESTYSSDAAYPEQVGKYLGTGQLRKYKFARVAFFPFVYHPKSGRLFYYRNCEVTINYSLSTNGQANTMGLQQMLSDRVADDRASQLFVNYNEAKYWYTPQRINPARQTHDYVIITTDALQDTISYLVAWKQYLGYSVNLVTTTWITNNYTGTDMQQKIRNFLIDKYIDWGIHYVLFVGNIDVIPMRYCFPNPNDHNPNSEFCTPTDYYYADLTGNWDSDGDGFYGEYGQDSVDFVPEVIVGRIPWNMEVGGICHKLVRFEQDTGTWKSNALLLGAIYFYENEDIPGSPKTDAAELMEEMIVDILGGWTYTKMYETEGLRPCIYPCDIPLTQSNVVSNWPANAYGIVNWGGHGAPHRVSRHLWLWDDGDSIPESPELMRIPFFQNENVSSLNDSHPSINFCCSCNNAWPEENNLARELIRHGSAGIAACTRPSYITLGWDDEDDGGLVSTDYYFFHYLINQNERIGDALFDAQVFYYNNFFWWDYISQHNIFCLNLYGEPSLAREGFAVPVISVHDHVWLDSGNDGFADPCDTISLTVSLLNSGIEASSVTAELFPNDEYITVLDSISNYGSIMGGATKDNASDPFVFYIADTAPCYSCTLNLKITADSLNFYDNIYITVGTPPLLIVDDDAGGTYESYFTASLERLNVSFHLQDSDDLTSDSSLYRYQALVWLTGDNPLPLDSLRIAALSAYLDSGGRLFITGQDVEGCHDIDFYQNYLHALVIDSSAYRIRVDGVDGDTISAGLTFLIVGYPGANNQDSPTIISPLPGADSIFSYRMGGCCGVKYDNGFKAVYLSYGFEAIASTELADTVMRRILEWFDIPLGIEEIATWHAVPKTTMSLQVSPNPFTQQTQIRFSIQDSRSTIQKMELSIYDISGRLVNSFNHETPIMNCESVVSWDGTDQADRQLGSGVYFIKLTADDYETTEKVLYVR
ncbi:hypothetical protein AMJ83_00480 [candidate division WOR_3 bacterium SM23_42]|uniref:Gingipain domain-containing protein n=1 Tax=candidate division WOR_3 bacterium SM23_42 TaxID=1703779 RepID=A0A0S8FXN8_UNCW3|nr:MAG: hypothetical protein AMJ83_00480 [candidate division WOR_3 bacterium SM23_42]